MLQIGDTAYMVESNRKVRSGSIIREKNKMFLFKFSEGGGVWLRNNRLYAAQKDAEAAALHRTPHQYTPEGVAAFINHLSAVMG